MRISLRSRLRSRLTLHENISALFQPNALFEVPVWVVERAGVTSGSCPSIVIEKAGEPVMETELRVDCTADIGHLENLQLAFTWGNG